MSQPNQDPATPPGTPPAGAAAASPPAPAPVAAGTPPVEAPPPAPPSTPVVDPAAEPKLTEPGMRLVPDAHYGAFKAQAEAKAEAKAAAKAAETAKAEADEWEKLGFKSPAAGREWLARLQAAGAKPPEGKADPVAPVVPAAPVVNHELEAARKRTSELEAETVKARAEAEAAKAEAEAVKAEAQEAAAQSRLEAVASRAGIQDTDIAVMLLRKHIKGKTPAALDKAAGGTFTEAGFFADLKKTRPGLWEVVDKPATTGVTEVAPPPAKPAQVAKQNGTFNWWEATPEQRAAKEREMREAAERRR